MEIDDLRREAIRCRNLGNRRAEGIDAAWYRDRGARLAETADAMAADAAIAAPETAS